MTIKCKFSRLFVRLPSEGAPYDIKPCIIAYQRTNTYWEQNLQKDGSYLTRPTSWKHKIYINLWFVELRFVFFGGA